MMIKNQLEENDKKGFDLCLGHYLLSLKSPEHKQEVGQLFYISNISYFEGVSGKGWKISKILF